jgi:uncharacterized protein YbjT (DUF2867 family)
MTDTGNVLITGATGNVGSAVLDNLGTTDLSLRTLVHDESKARKMRDRGVEVLRRRFPRAGELGCCP